MNASWGCCAGYLEFQLELEKGGVQSRRLAVMDDHADLHIFQTQPCSPGSPCLTALLRGGFMHNPPFTPMYGKALAYRHTKLEFRQQSLCSCADPHLKHPGGKLNTWGTHTDKAGIACCLTIK